jgi:hypothetical protein
MTNREIARQRLYSQRLTGEKFTSIGAAVYGLGAVQAQDYAGGKWALAQRVIGMNDAAIEQAINDGALVRTHILRPTWHLVTPQDLRWMLALTAERVKMKVSYYERSVGLDDAVFARSNAVIGQALAGGKHLTRAELGAVLSAAGIDASDSMRLSFIMTHAELDGLVCSGAMRGKQFTYAPIDERVPPAPALSRDEALAELARRYFTSRGLATVQDYVWWSGLTTAEARAGIEGCQPELVEEIVDGKAYWRAAAWQPAPVLEGHVVHLLPNYDEYIVAYADRSAIYDEAHGDKLDERENVLFQHTIVLDGMVVGTWKRTLKKREVVFEPSFFAPLTPPQFEAFEQAARNYAAYLGMGLVLKSDRI